MLIGTSVAHVQAILAHAVFTHSRLLFLAHTLSRVIHTHREVEGEFEPRQRHAVVQRVRLGLRHAHLLLARVRVPLRQPHVLLQNGRVAVAARCVVGLSVYVRKKT